MNPFAPGDVFVPATLVDDLFFANTWGLDDRRSYWLYLFGRLAPGVTSEQAAASIQPLFRNLILEVESPLQQAASDQYIQRFRARKIELLPGGRGQSLAFDEGRLPLLLLMAVTVLVLVVACVNVTNLLLAIAASEQGETAVRQALGARRRHLIMRRILQLTALGAVGAAVSVPVALATTHLVIGLIPSSELGALEPGLNLPVFGMGIVFSVLALLIAGLVPILQAVTADPMRAIRDQGGRNSSSRAAARFRSGLIATQIAFALALLVVSGLFIQSLVNIGRVDLGLNEESVLTFSISPGQNGYPPAQTRELFRTVEQRLSALPGVMSAAASRVPILTNNNWNSSVAVEGFDAGPDTDTSVRINSVGPAFFDALSIPLLAGRAFGEADSRGRPSVAIVNRALARKFDLGDDVVGKRMSMGTGGDLDIEIVGLIADTAYSSVKDAPPPQLYTPIDQASTLSSANFYVRAAGDPAGLIADVRALIRQLDADLPVDDLQTLELVVDQNVFLDQLIGTLASLFAVLATALAAVGLFGVLSFSMARRTRELGLRAALGASPARLERLVLAQTLRLALAGSVIGLLLGWLLGRLAAGLLYELSPLAPGVMAGSVAVLALVTLVAGYLPARRAARIHPVEALRYE
jgi:predicted permease